jgi:anthranilate synthase component 1
MTDTATDIATIDTDLLTPLGAYLRLRDAGTASFLLESVEQGRLGRYSLIGSGSRVVTYEQAERCGEPVIGYLSYDFVAKLEPTVPMPDAGRGLPESRFVVPEVLVRFDHARGVAEVLRGDPGETLRLLESDIPRPPRESGRRF